MKQVIFEHENAKGRKDYRIVRQDGIFWNEKSFRIFGLHLFWEPLHGGVASTTFQGAHAELKNIVGKSFKSPYRF